LQRHDRAPSAGVSVVEDRSEGTCTVGRYGKEAKVPADQQECCSVTVLRESRNVTAAGGEGTGGCGDGGHETPVRRRQTAALTFYRGKSDHPFADEDWF